MRRRICIVTGSRAEYGLLSSLMREIDSDPELELQIIVTGMHLSPEFGFTYKDVEEDGFRINRRVEMLLSSDSPVGISKSMGLASIGLGEAFADLQPDLVVLLGDRFETFCAATAACVARIPVAHIHGGEVSMGSMDEAFRHSITKLSHLHFTSTETYRKRVIQLGEDPERVFNVGAIGVENIRRLGLLNRDALERKLGFSLGRNSILVTFHPATLDAGNAADQFHELLAAIDSIPDLKIIFTKANADAGGRAINALIEQYVSCNREKATAFDSMGQLLYLSTLSHVCVVVGNSSSGIIEAPSLKRPTVNIGDRQAGRVRADSILDCAPRRESIAGALRKAVSAEFMERAKRVENPYEKKKTVITIKEVLRSFGLDGILKKQFYDLLELPSPRGAKNGRKDRGLRRTGKKR